MPPISPEQINGVVSTARQILAESAKLTSGLDPNYIRDAEPGNVLDAIALAGARQGCRRYADKGPSGTAARQARIERACRPYLDSIDYQPPPAVNVPFRGGNCSGALVPTYQIRSRISTQFNCGEFGDWVDVEGVLPASTAPQGPIASVTPVRDFGSFPGNANASISYRVQAANGEYFLNLGGSTGRVYWTTCGESYEYRALTFTPVSGEVGECPPQLPDYEPPGAPGNPGKPTEPFTRIPGIDIDIGVEINPDFSIDIDFGTGPVTIDPFGDDEGDDSGGDGGPPPGDVGAPGAEEPADESGDASGCAPSGSVLVGLKLRLAQIPGNAKEYFPGVYRGVCYVYMGTLEGLDHDPAGAMVEDGQFIFAEKDNLTCWRVSANNGYVIGVTPYYREVDE